MRSAFSNSVTLWPARASCWAAAMPAGPEPTTATVLPVFFAAHCRLDPAFFPGAVHDLAFDGLDGDRAVDDVQGAARLAGRGADAAGEFREIVGGVQVLGRGAPLVAIDQVVPVGNQVVDRAALVTEGNAAIHAARRLLADIGRRQRMDEFLDSCETRSSGFSLGRSARSISRKPVILPMIVYSAAMAARALMSASALA